MQSVLQKVLSQVEYLEVLEPKEFREEMKQTLIRMTENYQ